jgi:ATP-dependent Clp endopeptidase proteolytic subunit ClpP
MKKQPWIIQCAEGSNEAVILLYGYIYDSCASDFVKDIIRLEKEVSVINVRINSGGGDVFDGFAIFNAMQQCKAEINTYVDGIAGSMASIAFLGGKKRYISKVGRVMTHKPSAFGSGNSDSLRENADMLDSIEALMLSVYSSKTGKDKEYCKTTFLNGKDNWFDSDQALSEGLATDVFDAEPITIPETKTEQAAWQGYNDLRFAAAFTNAQKSNENMEMQLNAANKQALKLGDNYDAAAFNAAIANVVAKANGFDQMKTEKDTAVQQLNDHKIADAKLKVTAMLTDAKAKKGLSAETVAQFEADYAGKPEDLQKVLNGLPDHKTIVSQLKEGKEETDEDLASEWDKLDKSKGGTAKLKAENIDRYKLLFKAKYGTDYKG